MCLRQELYNNIGISYAIEVSIEPEFFNNIECYYWCVFLSGMDIGIVDGYSSSTDLAFMQAKEYLIIYEFI